MSLNIIMCNYCKESHFFLTCVNNVIFKQLYNSGKITINVIRTYCNLRYRRRKYACDFWFLFLVFFMRATKSIFLPFYNSAIVYPAPANLNYLYNFGIYALIMLAVQIITGIFLVMYYTPNIGLAFESVEHLMRDIPYGWLLRYLHANGASFFFIVVYGHIMRGLIYGSYVYPRRLLWVSGVIYSY